MISLLRSRQSLRLFLFFVCCSSKILDTTGEEASEVVMHHHDSESLLDHRKDEYLRYVEGCSKQMPQKEEQLSCHKYEQDRIDMNLNQPKMMGK
jgi:hypothetical protein